MAQRINTISGPVFADISSKEEWKKFFVEDISLSNREAAKCAEELVSRNLSGEDVMDLIFTMEVSDTNVFGLSMGYLMKTKRWLNNALPSNAHEEIKPLNNLYTATGNTPAPKVPRPMISMNINKIDFDQFLFE